MSESQDRRMEATIGRMLQVGVLISAALVLAGGILLLLYPSAARPDYSRFAPPASQAMLAGLHTHSSPANAVIFAGILLLVATPVARVLFCVYGFAQQRDWLYVAISACVLVILTYSLLAPAH